MKTQLFRFFALCMLLLTAGSCSKDNNGGNGGDYTPMSETQIKQILLEFYQSTGGENWNEQPTNWDLETRLNDWDGIDFEGCGLEIDIRGNGLTGELPASLFDISILRRLNLDENHIGGSLPENIGNASSLRYLSFENNDLTGTIPASLAYLKALEYLDLDGNKMSGVIPDAVRQMAYYSRFYLSQQEGYGFSNATIADNDTDRAALMAIKAAFVTAGAADMLSSWTTENALSDFEGIYLNGDGRVVGLYIYCSSSLSTNTVLPDAIGDLSELRMLELNYCGLTTLPDAMSKLGKLESLEMYGNALTAIPDCVFSLTNLRYLDLEGNNIATVIPEELGNLTNLTDLIIYSNPFTGTIPESIAKLTNLEYLDLDGCDALDEQPLPAWIGQLKRLNLVYMDSCNLTGEIPASLADCKAMGGLDISYNNLTGTLPESMADMMMLTNFYCNQNQLSGIIPQHVLEHPYFDKWSLSQQEGYGFTNLPSSPQLTAAPTSRAAVEERKHALRAARRQAMHRSLGF